MRFNSMMLLASAAGMAVAVSSANAQTALPTTPGQTVSPNVGNDSSGGTFAILGTGATSIQNVLRQEFQCLSGPATTPCNVTPMQTNFAGLYEEEGSGFGRQQWRSTTNQWTVAGLTNGRFTADHVQFAFADSSATASDVTTVRAIAKAVDAVVLPKYVLPVAVAYNPKYGATLNGGTGSVALNFRVQNTKSLGSPGVAVGGMQMSVNTYCRIFNGNIVNFNDAALTAENTNGLGNNPISLMSTSDDATRWANDGVPIRLVGRADTSGTTDIFTRALAAQCNSMTNGSGGSVTNKYLGHAETLPYNPVAGAPDFTVLRPDTKLKPTGTGPYAGTTSVISNDYYNGTSIVTLSGMTSNSFGTGLFIVANGSGAVAAALNLAPDKASPTTVTTTLLNGKLGYIASDYIANSPTGAGLHAAALKLSGSTYVLPSATQATNAFGSITPPDSASSGGTWAEGTDTRLVTNPAGGSTIAARRDNPLSWYDVLYATSTQTLASPTAGYPITGTTQFLGYRCYTDRNRESVVNFLGWNYGAVTKDSAGTDRTGVFSTLLNSSNIGSLPAAWNSAITETFLKNSSQAGTTHATLGALNLWLQNQSTPGGSGNSTCTSGGM
ncbi:MAG TPA: substrate-binding domain-containing protein [Sphingobium sp.]|uniref:substrate-binding domain-containing protein n=1 Tax=Sphingobium sp. TaxID=1912891 RepID=UPI002ED3F972